MKLKALLKELLLCRFRYNITLSSSDFVKLNIRAFNIKTKDDEINFDTNCSINKIRNVNIIKFNDRYKSVLKFIFKKKLIAFLSLFFIMIIFFTSNLTIREIVFKDELEYNYNVYQDVKNHVKKYGPFKVLDNSLNDISNELKQKYYNYAYIGLEKKGSKVIIDIEYIKHDEPNVDDNGAYSNIVSNADGKVVGIETKVGVSVVSINQIVSKGELLVSGNLNYYTNPSDSSKLVKSDALVFVEYAKYIEVEVPKKLFIEKYTNNYRKYYRINILNYGMIDKTVFDKNYIKSENIFKINKFLNIEKIYEYEKIDYQILLSKSEAKEYSLNKIYTEFESKKVNKIEKIEFIKLIKEEENGDFYKFSYIIKCIENCGVQEKILKED